MLLLADAAVEVAEVAVDAAPTGDMVAVVRTGEGGPLRDPGCRIVALGLDEHPRLRRRPFGRDRSRQVLDVVPVAAGDEVAATT